MTELRTKRESLRLSQSQLARLSGVSRFKICTFELGDASLTRDQENRLRQALLAEAERLRIVSTDLESEARIQAGDSQGRDDGD